MSIRRSHPSQAGILLVVLTLAGLGSPPAPALAAPRDDSFTSAMDRNCGTPAVTPAEREQVRTRLGVRALRPAGVTLTIPVAFHVITGQGEGDVSDAQIVEQVAELNRSFAGSGFQFTLASTDRTDHPGWFRMTPGTGREKNAKEALAVDPAHTLNVYTAQPGKNLLGWSYFPWSAPEDHFIHGVVVHWASLPGGAFPRYNLGRTLVHETGHYLGLLHTFQGGCVAPGDEIEDTPFEASPAFGCPLGRDTCVEPGLDPIENYMDYTDDACYTQFSADQTARMGAVVPVYRPSLGHRGASARATEGAADAIAGLGGVEFRGVHPNPIGAAGTLTFALPRAASVDLRLYDVAGALRRTLAIGEFTAGEHAISIDTRGLRPGTYFASLVVDGQRITRTVVLAP
jgi:hypothetical protein